MNSFRDKLLDCTPWNAVVAVEGNQCNLDGISLRRQEEKLKRSCKTWALVTK